MTPSTPTTMLGLHTATKMEEFAVSSSSTTAAAATSWLNFESANTTTNTIFKDETNYHLALAGDDETNSLPEEFMELSELDNSYRELESIPEVTDDEASTASSCFTINNNEIESLKQSILEEMFPGCIDDVKANANVTTTANTTMHLTEFEANDMLCQEVEKYLKAATGETTTIASANYDATAVTDDLVAKSWQLSDIPSPGSLFMQQTVGEENTDATNTSHDGEQSVTTVATSVADADSIFNALTSGAVMFDPSGADDEVSSSDNNNTYSVLGADGRRIQIMIVPAVEEASPVAPSTTVLNTSSSTNEAMMTLAPAADNISALSPGAASSITEAWSPRLSAASSSASSSFEDDESDEDWRPEHGSSASSARAEAARETATTSMRPRKKYERRAPRRRPDLEPYPKDKVDRKKAQNRTAAWKYREKKKAEQDLVDQELNSLMARNGELKKHLGDLEIQMKCLKQLMVEAGMGSLMAHI